jgi:hypothetical protein
VSPLAEEIVACAERTLAQRSARIEFRQDWSSSRSGSTMRRRRRGGLLRPVGRLASFVIKAAWNRATGDLHFGHQVGKGILEPATGRYMIDYGSFAQVYADGKTVNGRSGRSVETLPDWPEMHAGELLWLVRLLRGTTEARLADTETLHGTQCQKLAADVDMARASAATTEGLRPPTVERFEDLLALPVTVWIDESHVRRIQFDGAGPRSLTLELWDFGTPTDDLDWSRLPTFKSPEEAAYYAGERSSWTERLPWPLRFRTGR